MENGKVPKVEKLTETVVELQHWLDLIQASKFIIAQYQTQESKSIKKDVAKQ